MKPPLITRAIVRNSVALRFARRLSKFPEFSHCNNTKTIRVIDDPELLGTKLYIFKIKPAEDLCHIYRVNEILGLPVGQKTGAVFKGPPGREPLTITADKEVANV